MLELLVEKHQPEIILLQEIKCENSEFPEFYKTLNYNLEVNVPVVLFQFSREDIHFGAQ